MAFGEYLKASPGERFVFDELALTGLEAAHRVNRARCHDSDYYDWMFEIAGDLLGPGSDGEKSPTITDPALAFPDQQLH